MQGLRALAVILVVAHHSAFPNSGGFVGVDVFFVVSGFVISRLLINELEESGSLSFRRFYTRRVKRLLPALCLVLAAVAAASVLIMTPLGSLQTAAETGIGSALFSANAVLWKVSGGYFDTAAASNPLLHMWTLAVEEQFYVAFPIILTACWRIARWRRQHGRPLAIVLVSVCAGLSLLLCIWLTFSLDSPFGSLPHNRAFAFYGSPARAWEFGVGALLALAEPRLAFLATRVRSSFVAAAGLILMAFAVMSLDATSAFPGYSAVLPVVGTGLLIAAGMGGNTNMLTRILSVRPVTWIGDQSYSWYLWHWPLIVFLRESGMTTSPWLLMLAGALGLPLAWVTGRFVENPIRRDPRMRGQRAVMLGVTCVAVPAVAFSSTLAYAAHPPQQIASLVQDARPHYDMINGCAANYPNTTAMFRCEWVVPNAKGSVVLLGDSNAGQFAEPGLALARAREYNFTLATFGGCPFAPVTSFYLVDPHDVSGCNHFISEWVSHVSKSRPTVVILASASSAYVENPNLAMAPGVATSGWVTSSDAKAKIWGDAIHGLVQKWSSLGIATTVINTVPHFPGFDLKRCPAYLVYTDRAGCAEVVSTSQLAAFSARTRHAEKQAVRDVAHASVLDLTERICPRSQCSTYHEGHFAYRDGAHLSVDFALSLLPRLDAAVQEALAK